MDKRPYGYKEGIYIQQICHEIRGCYSSKLYEICTGNYGKNINYTVKKFYSAEEAAHIIVTFLFCVKKAPVPPGEFFLFLAFIGKGLYNSDSGYAVLKLGIYFRHLLPVPPENRAHLVVVKICKTHQQGYKGKGNQGKLHIYPEQYKESSKYFYN